jgi:hypothetical protein
MFPTLSPHGANYVGEEGAEDNLAGFDSLFTENCSLEDVQNVLKHSKSNCRIKSGERLDGYLKRKRFGYLRESDQRTFVNRLPYTNHSGLKAAAVKLFSSQCHIIGKFLRVWQWIDTCLALAFAQDNEHTIDFKMKWWIIVAHDVTSSSSIHYASKKWGKFALYLTLHFGGAIQPLPQWEPWFPKFPKGTWMVKEPGTLTREEKAQCRILSDKRGLPCGDSVTKEIALADHLTALTKGDTVSPQQEADLVMYSGMAAEAIKEALSENWFKGRTGHISLSNSACFENSRDFGGKRAYILSALRGWLCEQPKENREVRLPTGESYIEEKDTPRWRTVKPPGMDRAIDLPSGLRKATGILTDDFADGEQERVGFQLFCWAFSTLIEDEFLDHNGQSTGKPMPISRIAIGEPGCKVRIATRSKAAFIIYGQPFAHAMRELLEHHPSLRAGLGSGYQLFEWLKGVGKIPKYVMIGDFDAATDHIQHRAGRIALKVLTSKLGADRNGYANNFLDLLLSPRVIEEDGIVTITNSGCLMGEPGTKIVLTFLALVANCYARRGPPSEYFATAGDDQIDAADELSELERYAEASKVTTMVPSIEKWGIFTYQANYCQQLLDIQCGDPKEAEIAVPKPRLISPETKSGRGDDDTNPAYGKCSQLAKEMEWSGFERLNRSMILLFLRNMKRFIEPKPEVFLKREWGGLGLPGFPQDRLVRLLPQWHQTLIAHRELGDPHARKILASWSTSRILHRGLLEPDTDAYTELLTEFLPTATIGQLDLQLPPRSRYREKLKVARDEGWIPLDDVLNAVKESQVYENIWDLSTQTDRGYSSVSWLKRSERMEKISEKFPPLSLLKIPESPSWQPGLLAMVHGQFGLFEMNVSECLDLEEGEIRHKVFPLMGTFASPRVFLHYDNDRLILNATSRKRSNGPSAS